MLPCGPYHAVAYQGTRSRQVEGSDRFDRDSDPIVSYCHSRDITQGGSLWLEPMQLSRSGPVLDPGHNNARVSEIETTARLRCGAEVRDLSRVNL